MNTRLLAYRILSGKNVRFEDKLNSAILNSQIDSRDINFLNQLVRGTLKFRNLLDYYAESLYTGKYSHLENSLKIFLRLGLYQLLYMDVSVHAAVHETVEAARAAGRSRYTSIINAILRNFIRKKDTIPLPKRDEPVKYLSILQSHPEWLITRWFKTFGEEKTERLLEWNNHIPRVCFRQNINKISVDKLRRILKESGFEPKYLDSKRALFFQVENAGELLRHGIFSEGYCSVQDRGSSLVVELLSPESGSTVLDVCAAPGGKTTYIAQLIGDGKIYAYDKSAKKTDLISKEKVRLGLSNIVINTADARKEQFPEADYVLVDAPCTGTGVMDRRADLRWRKKEDDIPIMTQIQLEILSKASDAVKPGGVLLYSTCSLEEEENWGVVEKFLNTHRDFIIEPAFKYIDEKYVDNMGALYIFPPDHRMDGAFAVRMLRTPGRDLGSLVGK